MMMVRVTVSSSGFFRTLIKVGSYNLSLLLYNFFFLFFLAD